MRELVGVGPHDEEGRGDAVRVGQSLRGRGGQGDESSAPAEHPERCLEGGAADGVDHDVEVRATSVKSVVVKSITVDAPRPAMKLGLGAGAGRGHLGAEQRGELHDVGADAAGAAVHEHALARP